jgi:photosystem II stability/assembly factor-like uncharacterized protein
MKKIYLRWLILIVIGLAPLAPASVGYAQDSTQSFPLFMPMVLRPFNITIPVISRFDPPVSNGPIGGVIPTIIFDPFQADIVYLASFEGGVYKSYDKGETWTQFNSGIPTVQINTIAVDPSTPDTIYAGPYRYGVYKSTNGGFSWKDVSSGMKADTVAYSIVVDPSNPNIVYAATRNWNNPFYSPWQGILYKSTNGGASWSPSLINAGGAKEQDWVYSIAIDPHTPSTVYAAAHETGVYRSTNSGASWQSIDTGMNDLTGRSIVIDKTTQNPITLYMGMWHETGVYKSTNGGNSWFTASAGMASPKIYSITIDPIDSKTLYASTINNGIYKSTNSGNSWSLTGFKGMFFYTLSVDPRNNNTLLAGAKDDGLYKSEDRGVTWRKIQWSFVDTSVVADLQNLPDILGDPY